MEEHSNLFLLVWFVGLQTGNSYPLCHVQELSVLLMACINASMHLMVFSTLRFGSQERGGKEVLSEVFTLQINHQHHWQFRNGNH